jgi:hypothetical protein
MGIEDKWFWGMGTQRVINMTQCMNWEWIQIMEVVENGVLEMMQFILLSRLLSLPYTLGKSLGLFSSMLAWKLD